MHRSACLFLVFLFSLRAVAQISFTNQTEDLLDVDTTYTGIAVAVADMNGDGLDDIVRMHFGTDLLISYQ
ncbi:MAG: CRTAC1 family protein, partial [Bacteroidetes bacterium]